MYFFLVDERTCKCVALCYVGQLLVLVALASTSENLTASFRLLNMHMTSFSRQSDSWSMVWLADDD